MPVKSRSTPLRRPGVAFIWAILNVCTAGMVFADAPVPALPDVSAERAYSYLEVLAGEIGERPAGSAAESRAVDYIAGQFKSWGLEVTGLR